MGRRHRKFGTLYLICALGLVLTVAACVVYVQQDQLLVGYQVRQYLQTEAEAEAEWLIERRYLSLPIVLDELAQPDNTVCRRVGDLVERTVARYPDPTNPGDSHLTLLVAAKLNHDYSTFSPAGRSQAVRLTVLVLSRHLKDWSPNVPTALETAGGVLVTALHDPDGEIRSQAIESMYGMWSWRGDGLARTLVQEWQRQCYAAMVEMLADDSPDRRARTARALAGAPFHEGDLALIGLLSDPDPAVKKAALMTVAHGAADCLTSEQKTDLVEFLHDPDVEVQQAATQLLLNAGISESVIHLAKLVRHPQATERVQAVSMAMTVLDDPTPWLLEMSNDASPAVRLAVARAAGSSKQAELAARIREMADADPDANVREAIKCIALAGLQNKQTQ